MPAPELFDLLGINQVEKEAMAQTKVELEDIEDRRCATVCGRYGVDQVIFNAIEEAKHSRSGGLATAGDCVEQAHVICITGDGASLTHATTGVRIGIFCGSTELLNQSSSNVTDIVMYQVCCAAVAALL